MNLKESVLYQIQVGRDYYEYFRPIYDRYKPLIKGGGYKFFHDYVRLSDVMKELTDVDNSEINDELLDNIVFCYNPKSKYLKSIRIGPNQSISINEDILTHRIDTEMCEFSIDDDGICYLYERVSSKTFQDTIDIPEHFPRNIFDWDDENWTMLRLML